MTTLSGTIAVAAVSAGILTATSSSAIDSLFTTFVAKKSSENIKTIIKTSLLTGCTGGILVSIIFYTFAIADDAPIETIVVYSIIIGIVSPLVSKLLIFIYLKLFCS